MTLQAGGAGLVGLRAQERALLLNLMCGTQMGWSGLSPSPERRPRAAHIQSPRAFSPATPSTPAPPTLGLLGGLAAAALPGQGSPGALTHLKLLKVTFFPPPPSGTSAKPSREGPPEPSSWTTKTSGIRPLRGPLCLQLRCRTSALRGPLGLLLPPCAAGPQRRRQLLQRRPTVASPRRCGPRLRQRSGPTVPRGLIGHPGPHRRHTPLCRLLRSHANVASALLEPDAMRPNSAGETPLYECISCLQGHLRVASVLLSRAPPP